MQRQPKKLVFLPLLVSPLLLLPLKNGNAGDFRPGVALGFGGTGIKASQMPITVGTNTFRTDVERNEGPGTISVFVDYLLNDRESIALEHSRGFRLGPLSSGVSFTGLAGRYYFSPIPTVIRPSPDQTLLLIKRFSFFAGLAAGMATGAISRDGDLVPNLSGSGIYGGLRLGADYPLAPGIGIRPEIFYSTTFLSSSVTPVKLSESSLQLGIYFFP